MNMTVNGINGNDNSNNMPHVFEVQDDPELTSLLFSAHFSSSSFDAQGNMVIKLVVPPKYRKDALDIVDYAGKRFWMLVWRPKRLVEIMAEQNNDGDDVNDDSEVGVR